jgi:hypothetical protein
MTMQPETLQEKTTRDPAEEKLRRRGAMRKHATVVGLAFAGFAAFALYAGWAFYMGSRLGGGWRSLEPILPFVLGGCVAVAALTGALMWLVFYSADHGYDNRIAPPTDSEGHVD